MSTATRYVEFEGSRNFRDMGGIATATGITRRGVLYRSDRLSNLTVQDHRSLSDLGITTVFDMRVDEERAKAPNCLPSDPQLAQITHAFLPRHTHLMFERIRAGSLDPNAAFDAMLEQYRALATDHTVDYLAIINDILAHSDSPSVFHCTSGKDRTGMIAAILLLAIDASTADIVQDYVMTEGRIEKVDLFTDGTDPQIIDVLMAANPRYIQTAIAEMVAAYGSTQSYLEEGIGITAEMRQSLRSLLVE
ncbi:MAG: protein-tyrosine phosphatase [Gammaproteobacteria bacterium]|jgi:protein-tyrosine phosphatase